MAKLLTPGTSIGRFTIESVLADSELGITYRAESGGRLFVLKAVETPQGIRGIHSPEPSFEKVDGVQVMREIFDNDGMTYYVMDYIEGSSLRDYVHERGKLSETEMLDIMLPVIQTMAELHYVHLDIKPSNIIIPAESNSPRHPVLIDFGVRIGEIIGYTPGYAPPEQSAGQKNLSQAADVYSLGATMLFCLTGKRPPETITEGYLHQALSGVSHPTAAAIRKAVSAKPSARQANAVALLDDLDDDATRIMPQRRHKPLNVRMAWIAVIAVALLALLCWLVVSVASQPDYTNYIPIEEAEAESME